MKNFVKQNKAFTAYVIISLITGTAGFISAPANALIYMIFVQYLILPVAGFICSVCAAKKGGVLGFLSPFIFTVIATLLPFLVFKSTDIVFFIFAGIPCSAGLVLGGLGYAVSKSRKLNKQERKEIKEEKKQDKEAAAGEFEDFSVEAEDVNTSESNAPEEADEEEVTAEFAD